MSIRRSNMNSTTEEEVAPQNNTGWPVGWIVVVAVMAFLSIIAYILQNYVQPLKSARIWGSSELCKVMKANEKIKELMVGAAHSNMVGTILTICSPVHFVCGVVSVYNQCEVIKILKAAEAVAEAAAATVVRGRSVTV